MLLLVFVLTTHFLMLSLSAFLCVIRAIICWMQRGKYVEIEKRLAKWQSERKIAIVYVMPDISLDVHMKFFKSNTLRVSNSVTQLHWHNIVLCCWWYVYVSIASKCPMRAALMWSASLFFALLSFTSTFSRWFTFQHQQKKEVKQKATTTMKRGDTYW